MAWPRTHVRNVYTLFALKIVYYFVVICLTLSQSMSFIVVHTHTLAHVNKTIWLWLIFFDLIFFDCLDWLCRFDLIFFFWRRIWFSSHHSKNNRERTLTQNTIISCFFSVSVLSTVVNTRKMKRERKKINNNSVIHLNTFVFINKFAVVVLRFLSFSKFIW